MKICLIIATDHKYGIGKNGIIPWDIKEDMIFFQDVTKRVYIPNKKNAVIIGKNTWLSLSTKGFKDRITIVVSSTLTLDEQDVYQVKSFDDGIELCKTLDVDKIFIGGGRRVYIEALENLNINELYHTKIDYDYDCDVCVPEIETMIEDFMVPYFDKQFVLTDQNIKVRFIKMHHRYQQRPSNTGEQQYLNILSDILNDGHYRLTRNSYTWSTFGKHLEFDLRKGFPLLTTKRIFLRGVFEELIWFLKGDTNANHLSEKGVKIWNANSTREFLDNIGLHDYKEGDIGPLYGYQWLHFNAQYEGCDANYDGKGMNQIKYCMDLIKKDPYSRRIMMTAYNPLQANEGCLFPCHSIVLQFYIEADGHLSLACYNRSQDIFLGTPFNIASSSLLLHMFCMVLNNDPDYKGQKLEPGRLIMTLGDTHIYKEHYSEVIRQILREPYDFPILKFKRQVMDMADFTFDDIELEGYNYYPNIAAKMIA